MRSTLLRSAGSWLYAGLQRLALPDLGRCFDASYYLNRYPDVEQSGMDPLAHFLLYGGREGRQPDRLFDTRYYAAANPDVVAAGANPLVHFLRYGWKEGRRPNPLFDASFYRAHNPGAADNPRWWSVEMPIRSSIMWRGCAGARSRRPGYLSHCRHIATR